MNTLNYFLNTIWQLHLPIIKNTVFFISFQGQYNDNPKFISEYLHSVNPEINIVWAIGEVKEEAFPDYVKKVKIRSHEYCKYLARAQVVIDNYMGCRHVLTKTSNPIKRLLFKLYSKKRKKQLNISTWHGTPLKHISLDEPQYAHSKKSKVYTNSDMILAGCMLTADAFKSGFRWTKTISMFGTPRNDILFSKTIDRKAMKEKLLLPKDRKIILFAPTFRNNISDSGINQLNSFNFANLLDLLKIKFGGEWSFVFRVHNNVLPYINVKELVEKYPQSEIINGNMNEDMAEYLVCADILITDYSGSMFDFAITQAPCFLYAPDRENYEKNERGFYIDYDTVPFPISESMDELLDKIKNFKKDLYIENVQQFLKKIGNIEDGYAAQRVVEVINSFIY